MRVLLLPAMLVAAAALLGAPAGAPAGFIFTAQDRSVSGELGGNLGHVGPQTITAPPAPNFSVFDATVSLTDPNYGGGASAHQRSTLLADAITLTGETGASRPAMVGTGWANASSNTNVNFDLVNSATEVTLVASGTVHNFGSIPNDYIRLTGPGPTFLVNWGSFNSTTLFPGVSGSRATTLTLGPGSYQLSVRMDAANDARSSHGASNFNVALTIPEPAGVAVVVLAMAAATTTTLRRRRRRQ
jgi:hypothetical protein